MLAELKSRLKSTGFALLLGSCVPFFVFAQEKEKPKNEVIFDQNHNLLDEQDKQKGIKASENEFMFTEGVKLYILEEYQKALEIFEKCKEDNKDNAAIHFKIAECLVRLQKFEKAVAPAEKAVALAPKNQYYYWLLAEIFKAKDDYKAAIKTYKELIEAVPNEENYYFELANTYLFLSKYDDAIKIYNEAEKRFGLNEATIAQKQKIYLALNDVKNATIEGQKLIDAFPEEQDYWLAQAEMLIDNDKYEEADKLLSKFIKAFPDDGHALLLLSEVYAGQGNTAKQKETLYKAFGNSSLDLEKKVTILLSYYKNLQTQEIRQTGLELAEIVLKTHPETAKAYQIYGDFLVANNRKKEARDAYLNSLKYGKDNYKIWERIILFDHELGDFDAMLKHANEVVELFPNQGIFWFYNGTANLIKQQYEESIAALEQAKMFTTSNAELQFQIFSRLGDAYNAVKDYTKSDKYYDKALELRPDDLPVLNNYSYYLSLRKTKLELAKKMSAKLVAIEPDNATYLDTYAWVLFTAGEYENARKPLEKAAATSQNSTIIEHYGDVLYKLGMTEAALVQWKKAQALGSDDAAKLEKKINEKKWID